MQGFLLFIETQKQTKIRIETLQTWITEMESKPTIEKDGISEDGGRECDEGV